jgi:hypothetical protein
MPSRSAFFVTRPRSTGVPPAGFVASGAATTVSVRVHLWDRQQARIFFCNLCVPRSDHSVHSIHSIQWSRRSRPALKNPRIPQQIRTFRPNPRRSFQFPRLCPKTVHTGPLTYPYLLTFPAAGFPTPSAILRSVFLSSIRLDIQGLEGSREYLRPPVFGRRPAHCLHAARLKEKTLSAPRGLAGDGA